MLATLARLVTGRPLALAPVSVGRPRPAMIENLEGRTLLHGGMDVAAAVDVPAVVPAITLPLQNVQTIGSGNFVISDVRLEGVKYDAVAGLLTAIDTSTNPDGVVGTVSGFLAGLPFTTNITKFALDLLPDGPAAGTCSVLDLELAPIDIDLLGLHVDTSPICLSITASRGEGILGDLLCGLAGSSTPLQNLSGLLTGGGLNGPLSDILTQALGQAKTAGAGAGDICDGECEILDLAVGPVNLNLLGVTVELDNCAKPAGPVQVCVSASEGEGLLGDLLCGIARDGVLPDIGEIGGIIRDVLGKLKLPEKQVDKLVKEVTRLLGDGNLSLKDIAHLTKSVTKLLGKA